MIDLCWKGVTLLGLNTKESLRARKHGRSIRQLRLVRKSSNAAVCECTDSELAQEEKWGLKTRILRISGTASDMNGAEYRIGPYWVNSTSVRGLL